MNAQTGNETLIDLAREADFRLGGLSVSPSSREVTREGEREALEPRVMQVLVALYRANGAVVSRDELITRCWEGRIVGEDAINRAIWRLRKLAEADGDANFTIETIPRVGYRLMASQPLAAAEAGSAGGSPARKSVLIAAAVAIMAAAVLHWIYPRLASVPAQPVAARVAVLRFDTLSDGPQARHFADALTDEIVTRLNNNHIQVVSRADAATLRGPDRDRKGAELGVSLLLDGTVQDDGKAVKVRVHLDDPVRHATLWSGSADGPADKNDQLQASIARTIVAVLACSNRALVPGHGLTDPDLLSRYLHACDIFLHGPNTREGVYELLASLREVVAKAPGFAPAHSDLAKFALFLSARMPPDQAAPLRQEAEAEAHKALALDPKSPDGYIALAELLTRTDWVGREKLARKGVASDPAWPISNGYLGTMLADAGRLQDAILYRQKAAAADLQIEEGGSNVQLQCGSGQFEPATSDLFAKLKHNPADGYAGFGLRNCLKYARRWAELRALALTPATNPANRNDPSSSAYDTYLVAYEFGKPADVARARNAALAAGGMDPVMANAIEALSVLGFTDDAFAVAQRYTPHRTGDAEFLFFTLTTPLRRDPRFMQLAARLGLIDYWRSSGHWPDFCADPTLPYSCRAEANRLSAAK